MTTDSSNLTILFCLTILQIGNKAVFLLDSQKFFKVIVYSLIVTKFLIVNLY